MTPVELALTVGEASLRASVALVGILTLRRAVAGHTSARARRALLLAAVLGVPLLPVASVALPGFAVGWPDSLGLASLAGAGGASVSGADRVGMGPLPRVVDIAAIVWLTGAVAMTARVGAGVVGAYRRVRSARPLEDPAWLASRDAVAAELGVRRPPDLRVAATETMPIAVGVARPVVLVPDSALEWSASRRRAVLAHEIGHLAHREPLARIAAELVRAIHWFDPLVRQTVRRLRRESELAADEAALGIGIDPGEYAGHLVALARLRLGFSPWGSVPALASNGELGRRVEAILSVTRPRRPGRLRGRAVGIAAIALAAVLLTAVPRLGSNASLAGILAARHGISEELAGEILTAAGREGIDGRVAFGLVAEESGFDPGRVSRRGAVGLTQVLPATARVVEPGITAEELREVSVNLRVGFRYLRRQIDGQDGDVAAGLLAYAIGPRRLDELRRSGARTPTEYPDRILTTIE